MQHTNVRQVDLTNCDIVDEQLYMIAAYLQTNPDLRSLTLDENNSISNDGIAKLAKALVFNTKLVHLSIKQCKGITNEGMIHLRDVVANENMLIYSIEFDADRIEKQIGKKIKKECTMNKQIQENLKPVFFKSQKHRSSPSKNQSATTLNDSKAKVQLDDVAFAVTADVSKYMQAAIKCWRQSCPRKICIENQSITDSNVNELCEFLKDRNMITELNLRRNKITNLGIPALIDWIDKHDTALIALDISRNRISRDGASQFLTVLQKTARITDF